jgi:hypothetical protein
VFDWLLLVQLALSAGLLAVIGERAAYLWYVAPASAPALRWLGQCVEEGRVERVLFWARKRPGTHVAQILLAQLEPQPDGEHDLPELLSELTERAVIRLRLLRVGATVASTSGLLVGIVRISGGYAAPSGLLALEAGLTERLTMSSALFSMAVGVGTSAVCFYATSLFRRAAQQLVAQSVRAAQLAKIVA